MEGGKHIYVLQGRGKRDFQEKGHVGLGDYYATKEILIGAWDNRKPAPERSFLILNSGE